MIGVRRALIIATADRYLGVVSNFVMVAAVSRLLTPGEVGVWAIGSAIAVIAVSIREFATTTYLIQRRELAREDVRAAFTVMLLLTTLISGVLAASAAWVAAAYGAENLTLYIQLVAMSMLVDLIAAPIAA